MAAKAGEEAQKTGDFICDKCEGKVHVKKGDKIPKCPECGNKSFSERRKEPSTKSGSKEW